MPDAYTLLTRHVAAHAKMAGMSWDTYDADFLLGIVQIWLGQNNSVLTDVGVARLVRVGVRLGDKREPTYAIEPTS